MAIKTSEIKPLSGALAQRGVRGLARTGAVGRLNGRALANNGVGLVRIGDARTGANGIRVGDLGADASFNGISLGDLVMVVE